MTTGALSGIAAPADWRWRALWSVAPRVKEFGRPELSPLSVYLDAGVVPRDSRGDNHNQLGEDLSRYLVVRPYDIVFNKLRTWQGGLGVSKHEGIVSPAYFVCRPDAASDSRFLHYLLRSKPYLAELTRISKWMPPSQFDTPWETLRKLPMLLPPLEEQRRIADFLDAETARIDGLVNAEQRVLDRLVERRTAGVVTAVSGGEHAGRRASTLAWLDSIPESWQEVRVGLMARMGSGHTPSRSHPEWWVDCTIPWITTGEVKQVRDDRLEDLYETREKISELGLANSSAELHPKGTVFLCRTASAGYSGVMGSDMATSQDFVTWTCGPRLNPHFLLWCLRAMRSDLLGRLAMGSTHKTIYVPDLQMLRIPVPSLDEQGEIIDAIRRQNSRIDNLTDKVRRQVELLTERRQALITAAVTGQFDVTTASGRNVTDGVTA
ncbi:restriction endonuclease subunit S [Streptomyces virginiae]|uniref:restriction endonuclease subunit S n=1 Tax=Streptomyces virginiae TaxID=1961 RepID=UPI002DDC1BB5|nr:restriction endonuclease subunit S [Streptomyces virginiae]WSC78154.1 restriction endonuclease subunit S [Streptomyces virginiae]